MIKHITPKEMEYQTTQIDPMFHTQSPVLSASVASPELFACRACLATDINLFDIQECDLAGQFQAVTGLPVPPGDGLPQHLCPFCFTLLQKFCTFRKKCKRALDILEMATQIAGQITTDYIRIIDRQAEGLVLPLTEQSNLMYQILDDTPPTYRAPETYQVPSTSKRISDEHGTARDTPDRGEALEYSDNDDMIEINGDEEDNPFCVPGKKFRRVAVPLTQHLISKGQLEESKMNEVVARTGGFVGVSEALRRGMRLRGMPQHAIDRVLGSITQPMNTFYTCVYQKWFGYCKRHTLDPLALSLPDILNFLKEQLSSKGVSLADGERMRLALALLLGVEVANDVEIKALLKQAKAALPAPVYKGTWEVATVLHLLMSWHPYTEIPLVNMTKKLVVLLALTTPYSSYGLERLKSSDVTLEAAGVRLTGPTECFLPYYWEEPRLCPASCLAAYAVATAERRICRNLFINVKSPFGPASEQTIGRWLHRTLSRAGVDTTVFQLQNPRVEARSKHKYDKVSFAALRRLAVWTGDIVAEHFARHFELPATDTQ